MDKPKQTDNKTIRIALTCLADSPEKGAKRLAAAFVKALGKDASDASFRVYLDEALGNDASIFASVPLLATEHAILVLCGSRDVARRIAARIALASKGGIVGRELQQPTESLRLCLLVDRGEVSMAEDDAWFASRVPGLKKAGLRVNTFDSVIFEMMRAM